MSLSSVRKKRVVVGDLAPDFTLVDQRGREVNLAGLLKDVGVVVLYFYPRDDTPGCRAEACSFRDNYEAFSEAGAQVVGISSDSVNRHQQFAHRHDLPFILLSDVNNVVRKKYGVPSTFGVLPGRVTYVVDSHGVVRHIFSSQLQAEKHVTEALSVLRTLRVERANDR